MAGAPKGSKALKGIQLDTQSNLHPSSSSYSTLRAGGLDTQIGVENMGGRFRELNWAKTTMELMGNQYPLQPKGGPGPATMGTL